MVCCMLDAELLKLKKKGCGVWLLIKTLKIACEITIMQKFRIGEINKLQAHQYL